MDCAHAPMSGIQVWWLIEEMKVRGARRHVGAVLDRGL